MTDIEPTTEPPATAVSTVDKSGPRVRRMFGAIAHRYDLMNHLLSLNIDRGWRKRVARQLQPEPGGLVLDCCTGTADLAIAFGARSDSIAPIIGTDFCRPMLEIGKKKVDSSRSGARISLLEADTQRLPFASDTFAVVTVAFGLRNVASTERGLDEMIRVARPGGRVAVLEFSKPKSGPFAALYSSFFRHVLPRVGQALAPNGYDAYEYLPTSVQQFPEGEAMCALMSERGLSGVTHQALTMGVATLYIGSKPDRDEPQGTNE